MDLTYRTRLDKRDLSVRMADAVASFGVPKLRVSGGYFYSDYDPSQFYSQPRPPPVNSGFFKARNEATLGVSSAWGSYRASGFIRRDLANNRTVAFGGDAVYEDECFIFDLRLYRRYTSLNNDHGSTTVLLLFTFKTIGQFGYRAL